AEIVAANLCGDDRRFGGSDVSRKLKLMGVDVASFGDYETSDETVCSTVFSDPVAGTYRRLVFSKGGNHLVGGILIGDAADYGTLLSYAQSQEALPCSAGDLTAGSAGGATAVGTDMLPDSGQVCSSSNFSGTVPQHGEVSRGNRISARR
ncbi:MAG TPA: nitrite reductase (NAD(P)H), partial [Planctomycetaceae bacterium]|nr:nitrite reductase (NAD(P)H) [Planctomycetaceae bacterium]